MNDNHKKKILMRYLDFDNNFIKSIDIPQKEGFDIEDRIEKMKAYLKVFFKIEGLFLTIKNHIFIRLKIKLAKVK